MDKFMSKSASKQQRVSGGRIAVMIISVLLLSFIMAFGILLGISSLKHNGPVVLGDDATTVRKRLPAEGADPMSSSPLDNIGYMAYVLDSQPLYHSYAHNSTKSTGYEQITRTWKDFKTAEASGEDFDVMVASDLSYSALIKSSTQSCYIGGNEAHVRGGNKPGKNSEPTDMEWSKNRPSVYDKNGYKKTYGEFPKEISVYVISEETLISADGAVDNGDGTYSQKFYLNENCGVWYQYKMKTNGGLKKFPQFKRVEITFTFDKDYRLIQTYCEERATISPRALGGMDMASDSKTTTYFDYTAEGFDEKHFAYYNDFFKNYVGSSPEDEHPDAPTTVLEVLGGGFSKVLSPDGSGQQFALALRIGETDYDGKVFASVSDMDDVLNTLDARFVLEKRGSGKQDLYAEFKNGKINVYYSNSFALTADIDSVSQSVSRITEWINGLKNGTKTSASSALADEGQSGGPDIEALLNDLKLEETDAEAVISLKSDNLLGLGIGVDVALGFDKTVDEDGGKAFSVKSIDLNYVKYNGTTIDISAEVVPDNGVKISHDSAEAPADLADYINSVFSILESKTVKVDLCLEDKLISGLNLNASAYLSLGSEITAKLDVSADYKGISLKLGAGYEIDMNSGDYGNVYLHVSEINGKAVNAKIYCNIKDTAESVKNIIALFKGNGGGADTASEETADSLAQIINKVLNLNFGKIIGSLNGNSQELSLEVDVDELLKGLDVSLGIGFGKLSVAIDRENPKIHGYVSSLGVSIDVTGSSEGFVLDKSGYVDAKAYIDGVAALLSCNSYELNVKLNGTKISESIDLTSLTVDGTAKVAIKDGRVSVALPVSVGYNGYTVSLTAYYTVALSGGDYGDIYLDIEKMTVKTGETESREIILGAKVFCDINDAYETVNRIISKFKSAGADTVAVYAETDLISKVIETLLKLDYNEIIHATNEKLEVNLNVDEILSGLEISLGGISFGNLHLEYVTASGHLSGTLEKLGLSLNLSGSDNEVVITDGEGFVDLNIYLHSIETLLNRNSYVVKVDLDGSKIESEAVIAGLVDLRKLSVDAEAKASVNGGTVTVELPAHVSYDGYSLSLGIFYTVDTASGTYGKVYLHLTEFAAPSSVQALDAKVYCDIRQVADTVSALIAKFTATQNEDTAPDAEQGDVISNVISLLVSLDYKEIVNATNEKLTVRLDVDYVLSKLGISLGGISLGRLDLEFETATGTLSGSLDKLGLQMRVEGSDDIATAVNPDGYIDIGVYAESILNLLNSETYEVGLRLTGTQLTDKIDLTGLTLDASAFVQAKNGFKTIAVCVPLKVEYHGVSLSLTARYNIDTAVGGMGEVYIELTEVNGTPFAAKVYGNVDEVVDAVGRIISQFKTSNGGGAEAQAASADIISKVVGIVLNLDFAKVINATRTELKVTLNVDEILSAFDISLAGISFGELKLVYNVNGTLSGGLEKLGVSASVKGNNGYVMPEVSSADYLDVVKLLNIVSGIIEEGKAIAESKDVAFTVNADLTDGGSTAVIGGHGEVIWKDNTVKVALALDVSVDGAENFALNFVFDKTNMDKTSQSPVAVLSINGSAVRIFVKDTANLVDSFKALVNAFKTDGNTENTVPPDSASGYALSVGGYTIEELLKNENVVKALNAIIGFIGDFTVELADGDVDKILIKYSDKFTLTLCDSGYLSFRAETKSVILTGSAEAGSGSTLSEISADLANEKTAENPDGKYTYYDLCDFVEIIINGIFDYIENGLSFKDFIGDSAYSAELSIIGANSGISALEGVSVNATLYYDEGIVALDRKTKLLYADLQLDISGTKVSVSVAYKGQTLYVKLTEIGSTKLYNMAFRTDVHNIYPAAEEIVRLICESDLVDTINKFMGKGASLSEEDKENLNAFAMQTADDGEPAPDLLTKLLDAILSLDIEKSFIFNKQEGTAKINIDALSEALFGVKIGTADVAVNAETKTLEMSVALENSPEWFKLNGAPCERQSNVLVYDEYMDIGFTSTLIADFVKTLTDDNKHVYDLYTFTGSITVPVSVSDIPLLGSINITLEFKNATISVGLDENGDFYLTLAASMQKCTYATFVITENRDISITYSKGYIVLGRDIGTNSEIYKICTLNYLLDNLLDKNNSPARWLLGTNSTVWGILCDQLKVDLSSGLTKPETYELYEQLQQITAEGSFDLKKLLSGLTVKADGNVLSEYNGGASVAIDNFALSDKSDYYALDINAKDLTGGTLTALCALLIRTPDGGITGFKAYGAMGTMVSFNIDFSTYLEGVREVYGGKVLVPQQVAVDSYETLFADFTETKDTVTAENFADYYVYDVDQAMIVPALEYIDGATYFERVNNTYYVKDGENYVLATEFNAGTAYYKYVEGDSSAKLGTVAVRNYFAHAITLKPFDPDRDFNAGNTTPHVNKIFGCFNTEDGTYETSDILETIYIDVYPSLDASVPERTVEVLYGSTVHLISDFPEFADKPDNTKKLIYVNKDGTPFGNTIYIRDNEIVFEEVDGKLRVSLYKSEEAAYEVVFHFVGVEGMSPVSAALGAGDDLADYPLNDMSFLGWYKEESFKTKVEKVVKADAVNNVIHVYGWYIKTRYEAENGVNYSFDSKLDKGNGGYFVSGVNRNIEKYYNNQTEWLEIASEINGYKVYYIAQSAFANKNDDTAHSLVNVLVPETVVAVYDKAFLDNKGLRQVAFLADKVFFGGRADANGKTSVFYGCYTNVSNNVNTDFTVYYNGTQNNPYTHVSTANNLIDGAWNRIYFKSSTFGKTTYTMETQSSGWAYARFETAVYGLDGNLSVLPENVDLSAIIYNGIYFTNYAEAGNLANAIAESIKAQLGKDIYEVNATSPVKTNGKSYFVEVTITEHEEVNTATDINVVVNFAGSELYNEVQSAEKDASLADIYLNIAFEGKDNYAFIGWYTDAEFKNLAPALNNGRISVLYARIVPKTVTKENGVIYAYSTADENTQEVHYKVTGFNATDLYTRNDNPELLVLENELYGLKVTQIANGAFRSTGVKRVLVPFNVTYIGNDAFKDNVDMKEAILLADKVKFGGSVNGEDYPFFGCNISGDRTLTVLNVYYNETLNPNSEWQHFRTDGSKILYIPNKGGSVKSAGEWSYAEFNLTEGFILSDFGYADGLNAFINEEFLTALKVKFVSLLNERTAVNDGIIYKYTVTVTDEVVAGIHVVTVAVTENEKYWNKLELDPASNIQIDIKASAVETVSDMFFAAENATVTVKSLSGSMGLTSLTVSGITTYPEEVVASMSFAMPANSVTVSATSAHLPITSIKFISTVEAEGFTYDGENYTMTVDGVAEGDSLSTYSVSSTDYTFVGFAYAESGVLRFETDNAIHNPEYHIVWMHNRAEISEIKVEGGSIAATSNEELSSGIDSWYKYTTDSNGKPTYTQKVELNKLSVDSTVINPRMKYKLSLSHTGSGTFKTEPNSSIGDGDNAYEILDGNKVWLSAYKSDRVWLQVIVQQDNDVNGNAVYAEGAYYQEWFSWGYKRSTKIKNIQIQKADGTPYDSNIGAIEVTKDGTAKTDRTAYTENILNNQIVTVSSHLKVFFDLPKE